MNGQLSQTARRLIAVFLLLSLVTLIFVVAVVPVWRIYAADRETIPEYQAQIERFSRIAAKREALEAAVARLETARQQTISLLPERTETLAAAALQQRVKAAVSRSGGRLISSQVLPVSSEEAFSRIGIGIRASASIDSLREILHALESAEPHVVIDNLAVLARRVRSNKRKRNVESNLDVRFNLYGLMVADQESGAQE